MPIDFNATALQAGMNAFAVPIIINPLVSQPDALAYAAAGVWTVEAVHDHPRKFTAVDDIDIHSSGLQLSALPASPPMVGDVLIVNSDPYWFDSQRYDGQGGVSWTVKAFAPMQQNPLIAGV